MTNWKSDTRQYNRNLEFSFQFSCIKQQYISYSFSSREKVMITQVSVTSSNFTSCVMRSLFTLCTNNLRGAPEDTKLQPETSLSRKTHTYTLVATQQNTQPHQGPTGASCLAMLQTGMREVLCSSFLPDPRRDHTHLFSCFHFNFTTLVMQTG